MKFNFRKNKGITLVALVITIIVLLILAGVTLAMVLGDNGIVTRVNEAKKATSDAEAEEELQMAAAGMQMDYLSSNGTGSYRDYIFSETGQSTLKKDLGISQGDTSTLTFDETNHTITYRRLIFTVGVNGDITRQDDSDGTLTIGNSVNYSTTLNGQTLTDWKVFYTEGNYVWLIYGDYLPNAAIPSITNTSKSGNSFYSNTSRIDLINAITTKPNWSSLLAGTINGKSIDYSSSSDSNITAMGSPTLDLYKNSWNTKYPNSETYPNNIIYTSLGEDTMDDGLIGYCISRNNSSPSIFDDSAYMSGSEGYKSSSEADSLYYPYTTNGGYWLASPAARNSQWVFMVYGHNGAVGGYYYNYSDYCSLRPVICLPASDF